MKQLLTILITTVLTSFAYAQPAYLKDAVITVTLKNGKQYTYSANEYMVVKRGAVKKVDKESTGQTVTHVVVFSSEVKSSKKNRATLVVGYGPTGSLDNTDSASKTEIEAKDGVVGGVILSRDLNQDVHVSGAVLTNKTGLIGVGVGF